MHPRARTHTQKNVTLVAFPRQLVSCTCLNVTLCRKFTLTAANVIECTCTTGNGLLIISELFSCEYRRSFYRDPDHGRSIVYKNCICRDIPWQLPRSEFWQKGHSVSYKKRGTLYLTKNETFNCKPTKFFSEHLQTFSISLSTCRY